MQTIDFLETAKWIKSQFSEAARDSLFKYFHFERTPSGIGPDKPIIEATYELAVIREKLLAHPFALDVLRAFGLEAIVDPQLPIKIARAIAEIALGNPETPELHTRAEKLREMLEPLRTGWQLLTECIEPIERLIIPQEITNEEPFDDVLTIESSYGSNLHPTLDTILAILTNVDKLYASLSRLHGFTEYSPLRLIYCDSGSSFRFDFKGLGEPIKRIKELLIEGWRVIRHRKAEDFRQNNQALLEGLESIKQIQLLRQQGVLENEEAVRLNQQVITSVTSLFEAGVLPREVPKTEYVPNYELLEEYHRKLLPPAPEQTLRQSKKKKSRAPGKRRSSQKR